MCASNESIVLCSKKDNFKPAYEQIYIAQNWRAKLEALLYQILYCTRKMVTHLRKRSNISAGRFRFFANPAQDPDKILKDPDTGSREISKFLKF
jgi:hypothetical protein